MKKFLTVVMSLALVTTLLSACGETEKTETSNEDVNVVETAKKAETAEKSTAVAEILSVEDFMASMDEKVDSSKYSITDPTDTLVSYIMKSQNKKEFDLDCKISLGDGTSIDMPMAVEKLVDQGWAPNSNSDMDVELKAGYSTSALFKKDGVQLTVYSVNRSNEKATYGDGDIHRVLFDLYSTRDNYGTPLSSGPDFEICGGINNSSDIDDVIALLGEPTGISYSIIGGNAYSYISLDFNNTEERETLRIEFNADGSKIVNVDYECDVR